MNLLDFLEFAQLIVGSGIGLIVIRSIRGIDKTFHDLDKRVTLIESHLRRDRREGKNGMD